VDRSFCTVYVVNIEYDAIVLQPCMPSSGLQTNYDVLLYAGSLAVLRPLTVTSSCLVNAACCIEC
jgi:hypothetical protein